MADEPVKKTKRQVKNPETFRERAIKAAESPDKPRRSARVKSLGGKVASPVTKPVGKASSKVASSKVVKPLRTPARIFGKILLPPYIRNSWKELRLVTWPSWYESRRLTVAVTIFAIIFGVSIAAVDWVLDKVFKAILLN